METPGETWPTRNSSKSTSQIAAAELRIAIAEKELDNHVLQIENAKATDAFMRSKYTNEELYQWQVGQISGVYFQSYRLAYDLAKRAERCFRFELGLQDSSYINFGYWDSLKKGLLSGEKLQYDLRRLETAYLEQNRREFELTKHVSLALLDPLALVKLRETGRCFFRLPEEIFDLDYPGHYFRRIKSVSLTLPCVVGPYTTISCTLRLLKNSIRINTANGDNGYPRNTDDQGLPADDDRFVENNIPVKAIAASNAQNDSGVFELSFRDERYLPFEGAGAVSEWSLELFSDLPSTTTRRLRQAAAPIRLRHDFRRHPARQIHGEGGRRRVQERRGCPSAGLFQSGWSDAFSAHVQPAAGVPEPVAPFPAPGQPGRREHLRVGDVAESLPHPRRGKDAEGQYDMAAGTLHGRGKLRGCHDASVACAATSRIEHDDARPGQPIWRLAFQSKGCRRHWGLRLCQQTRRSNGN